FIVADTTDVPSMAALRRQRDIALEQQVGGVAIFRNLQWLPRAVLAPATLDPRVAADDNETALMLSDWSGGRAIPRRGSSRFSADLPRTRHSQVLLGDNFNSGWRAFVGGEQLEHSRAFGWSNRFELTPDARGEITVTFGRRWLRLFWVALQAVVLLGLVAMARTELTREPRRAR
ncbi:MAG: hypothetical protein M3164_07675, partial [Actinomycetota bacterium]|nr:hypothetical protein [Actinomycetota bacterium]